jgi:hypothetical protein
MAKKRKSQAKKASKVAVKRYRKATARKKASRKRVGQYNAQMGTLTGGEVKAKQREDKLVQQFQLEGMTAPEARQRARQIMRDNPRKDWRRG